MLNDSHCSVSDRSSLGRGSRITQAERGVARVIRLRDVNETDLIQNSASHVTYLFNHWSLELFMQDFYQLIHEDYLTCSLGGLFVSVLTAVCALMWVVRG